MESRWMRRKNENGEEEKFYPITHIDAIVGMEELTANYLPLSGGTLTGTTIEINNGTAMLYGDANNIVLGTEVDANNKRQLALYNENRQGIKNALYLKDIKNGETYNYLLYGEHNKPTASDVGAVKQSAYLATSILGLALTLTQGVYHYDLDGSSYKGNDLPEAGYAYTSASIYKRGTTSIYVVLHGSGALPRQLNHYNGTTWSGWSTQFIPLTGGTLSDTLAVERMNGSTKGKLRLFPQNRTVNGKDAVTIEYSIDDVSKAFLAFNETGIQLCNRTNYKDYNIFGEHNKPSGSYTGNGSATSRTINTGGIGNLLHLWCPHHSRHSIVGIAGAITWMYDGTVKSVGSEVCKFTSGVLTIASTDYAFNNNGVEYRYEVL